MGVGLIGSAERRARRLRTDRRKALRRAPLVSRHHLRELAADSVSDRVSGEARQDASPVTS
jgi:hypothetical protein